MTGTVSHSSKLLHRNLHIILLSKFDSSLVAGIRVSDNSHPRIGGQYSLDTFCGFRSAVGDYYLAGVEAVADADAAAVVERHPGRGWEKLRTRNRDDPGR